MNTAAFAKLLFHRTPTPTSSLLSKPLLCSLSSITRHYQLLLRTSPTPYDQTFIKGVKPALYHGTARTSNKSYQDASNFKADAVTIWEYVKQMRYSPFPALFFGSASLVPFVFPPAYMILTQTFISKLAFAQNVYGAGILSFVGGVRWGFAVPEESHLKCDWSNLGCSVVPCLLACSALMLPQTASTLAIMGGVAGTAYVDTATKGYPPWFKGMQFILSIGALLSLWAVLLCKATLSPHTDGELDASSVNKFGGSLSLRAEEICKEDQEAENPQQESQQN